MSVFFPKKEDTLTARNIRESYIYAYHAIYGDQPEVEIDGRFFIVDNVRRERHWMVMEVERLRQEAISKTIHADKETNSVMRMIRRLSRL